MLSMMRLPQVEAKYGRKRSSIYSDVKHGLLPKPISLGLRTVGWPEHEIEAVLAARVSGKSEAEIHQLVSKLELQRKELA